MKHYFLSPHLDDAVISCGGIISLFVKQGDEVQIVTFFQKQPNLDEIPLKMRVFADYSQRRQENKNAADFLGVQTINKEYLERAFKKPYLKNLYDCFKSPENGLDGYSYLNEITQDIKEILSTEPDTRLYAPLGVGNHIDHTHLFFSAFKALEESKKYRNFYFYEDPYGSIGNSLRRSHFLSKKRLFTGLDKFRHFSFYNFINNLGSNFLLNNDSIKEEFQRIEDDYDWKVEIINTKSEFENKIEAIKKYPSQINSLGGEKSFFKAIKRHFELWNEGEPLWQCFPKKE